MTVFDRLEGVLAGVLHAVVATGTSSASATPLMPAQHFPVDTPQVSVFARTAHRECINAKTLSSQFVNKLGQSKDEKTARRQIYCIEKRKETHSHGFELAETTGWARKKRWAERQEDCKEEVGIRGFTVGGSHLVPNVRGPPEFPELTGYF